ncbi:50S ribosomal protein L11 methyltransferase [Robiginitalea sp. IMCC44478]|uniref:50S ribosomal protein L11 methyltransferase n=1 Tax=Robiginitalea sp. IMCC44478 TaxID=3459122 RepID=UPI0040415F90
MYIRCSLTLNPPDPAAEIFIAALSELGFESFEETDNGLKAYIQEEHWDEKAFAALPYLKHPDWSVEYQIDRVPLENWNAVWESEYQPITIGDQCVVRADFHPKPDQSVAYDLVITPKMSFGTGHHQTTYLMLSALLQMESLEGKAVLDMGAGTGVLAILAAKKGASPVFAVDIEPWCVENCLENALANEVKLAEVLQGGAEKIQDLAFDIILANINKNILLADLPSYAKSLKPGGLLLLSGFYSKDIPDLEQTANNCGLLKQDTSFKEQWALAVFLKDT